jgi:hypothetical protein
LCAVISVATFSLLLIDLEGKVYVLHTLVHAGRAVYVDVYSKISVSIPGDTITQIR